MESIRSIGAWTLETVASIGRFILFFISSVMGMFRALARPGLIIKQMFSIGVLTTLIVVIAGLFVGMVLGLQGYNQMVTVGAESSLGLVVAMTLVRELGPVVTGLLFAGRAGSAITAEIGLMKATEQISALEMMAVDPMTRVVGPRFWAGLISMPLLAIMFSAVGIIGCYLIGVGQYGIDDGIFWSSMTSSIDVQEDILNGVWKSFAFGAVITWIALYQGFYANPTSEGVSRATTQTVVVASLSVLGLNYLLTAFLFGGV